MVLFEKDFPRRGLCRSCHRETVAPVLLRRMSSK